jgi:hypothetical protein
MSGRAGSARKAMERRSESGTAIVVANLSDFEVINVSAIA